MSEVDRLEVKVEAQARGANSQLDTLVRKLSAVKSELGSIDASSFVGMANGVSRLASAMQQMNMVKTTDFTRLARNIQSLGSINTANLNQAASAMSMITKSLNSLGAASSNAQSVADLGKSISKLGNRSVASAITNIPQLSSALKSMMQTLSGAPAVSQNVIQMTNAMASLSANGAKVSTASKNLSTGFKQYTESTRKATDSSRSLAYYIGKLYANYFMLIRATKWVGSSIKSSMDYIEEYNYYNVTMDKVASEWSKNWEQYGYDSAESYGKSFQGRVSELLGKMTGYSINTDGTLTDMQIGNLGLDVTALTNYSAGLMQVTNSLGLTGEASTATTKALTMLAGDMSSFRNLDLSTVMTNFQSGLIGQSRSLYKYGIDITNATLANYAYELGISKSVSAMSQSEKMQLRMIAILDQSKVSWGDLANTINSPSNQLRLLQNNFVALSRTIGNIFLPVVAKVLPYINGLVIAIRRLFTWVGSLLGVDLSGIIGDSSAGYTDAFDGLADDADDAASAIDGATNSAKELKNEVMDFDEVRKLSDNTSSSGSGSSGSSGGGAPIDLTDQLNAALADYEKVWNAAFDGMSNTANKYADDVVGFFKGIAQYAEPSVDAVKRLWSEGLSKFADFNYENGKNFINDFLVPVGKWTLGEGLPRFFDVTNDLLKDINWSKLSSSLDNLYKSLGQFAIVAFDGALDFYQFFLVPVGKWTFNDAVPKLSNALADFAKSVSWSSLNSSLEDLWKALSRFVTGIGDGLVVFLQAMAKVGSVTIGALAIAVEAIAVALDLIPVPVLKIAGAEIGAIATAFAAFKAVSAVSSIVKVLGDGLETILLTIMCHPVAACTTLLSGLAIGLIAVFGEAEQAEGDGQIISDSVKKITDSTNTLAKSVGEQKKSVSDTYAGVRDIADKYFKLAENFDNLTDTEKEMLKTYAQYLVEKCPQLAGSIDTVTGEFKGQKEEVYKTIDALEAYAKALAMEDLLKDLYTQQYNIEQQLKSNTEQYSKAESVVYKYAKQLTGMSKDTFDAAYEINSLGDAFDVVKTLISDTGKDTAEYRNEVGLTSKEVWTLSNDHKQLTSDLDRCNSSIDDAADSAAQATAKYDDLTSSSDAVARSVATTASNVVSDNNKILSSAQATASLISGSVQTSSQNSQDSIAAFYTSTANTFNQLGSVGTNGGSLLGSGFKNATSDLPGYSNGIYSQIYNLATSLSTNAGNDSGSNLVASYRNQVNGVPNTTAVAFLSIVDAVNAGSIGANIGSELMNNLANEIDSNAWRIHSSLTDAISSSYQAELSGDTYSTGDPMSTGFMTLKFKGYATGGYPDKGQYFLARESGPELVGTMGGHTAVANNDQIVEGIQQGVYNAVSAAMMNNQSTGGGSDTRKIQLFIGGKEVTNVVVKEINNQIISQGECPILI